MILNCLQLKYLHIRNEQIKKFQYHGLLLSFNYVSFRHEDPLSMEDVMLDFRGGPGYDDFTHKNSQSLLSTIAMARIVTICRWAFEVCFLFLIFSLLIFQLNMLLAFASLVLLGIFEVSLLQARRESGQDQLGQLLDQCLGSKCYKSYSGSTTKWTTWHRFSDLLPAMMSFAKDVHNCEFCELSTSSTYGLLEPFMLLELHHHASQS